ncbi:hypothetical protein CQ010_11890 [Arthrobacter sp. MYb211]|uniref:DUF6270 domain-containing protein n=1 Tax=Micrococcaceae TaxID=1268 RepID=UPI000CFD7674|nr:MULTISPECIES: DUF6270 domain-containing protein [unclassified Arthrobacter]PRA14111.1 hypothetical protein CQ015_02255 [Arthrobacter sp. MYb221]PRC06531.1 hypothetical protein CQ010_11890 [Arthrobacter sp. MYb211]
MKRVFIYGSCVTRDSVAWFKYFNLEMAGYVARQSLLSTFRRADSAEFKLSKITSAFQRRMAKNDIEGNMRFDLRRSEPDVVFWDICDERMLVRKIPGGGMITQSRDYVTEGIHPGPLGYRYTFGTDEHFELWGHALGQFMQVLDQAGLARKLYLNATPWAIVDEFGNNHAGQSEIASKFNSDAQRYLELAGSSGANVVAIDQSRAISRTEGHQWGPAPFHYVDDTYSAMLEDLAAAVGREQS